MRESLVIIDTDYTLVEDKSIVRLYCKNNKGKTILIQDPTFEPYFYVATKGNLEKLKKKIEELDLTEIGAKIIRIEIVEKNWQNEKIKLLKIVLNNPKRVPDVRNEIKDWEEVDETYEYDIPFHKRYLIDKQIEPTGWIEVSGKEQESNFLVDQTIVADSVKPIKIDKEMDFRVFAFDIEMAEEGGKEKIIMISLFGDNDFKKVLTTHGYPKKPKYVEVLKDEELMIKRFLEIIKDVDPDFLCTYNGDNFDFPKLKERADEYKISLRLGRDNQPIRIVRRGRISSAKMKGRIHIDLFDFVNHILSPSMKSEVLTLDEVAQELLGIGKKGMKYKEMVEIWERKDELEKLAEYSLWDSELTLKLSHLILPQIFALSKLTGQLPFDVCRYTYSQLVEAFYMRKAFLDDVLVPNRPKTEEIEQRRMEPIYKGAIVIEPKKGIHSNVLVFDFRSLYPTVIVTHNIDPWNFNCTHIKCKENKVPETKWHFCIKQKGFIPKHLEELIETRKQIKEMMKKMKKSSEESKRFNNLNFAIKTISNATYGYFSLFSARWYKRECGVAAAAFGRAYITKVIEMAKDEGFKIIYSDTDSCFVTLPSKS